MVLKNGNGDGNDNTDYDDEDDDDNQDDEVLKVGVRKKVLKDQEEKKMCLKKHTIHVCL